MNDNQGFRSFSLFSESWPVQISNKFANINYKNSNCALVLPIAAGSRERTDKGQ